MRRIAMSKKTYNLLMIVFLILTLSFLFSGCYPMEQPAQEGEAVEGEQAEATTGATAGWMTWIWLIILGVAFYFLLIRPQRQRTKKQQDLLSSIKRGDEVVTIGGFYGRVKDVLEDSMIITIASGVDVKVSKSAVSKKVSG